MRYFELYPTFMGIKGLGVKRVPKEKGGFETSSFLTIKNFWRRATF